MRSHVNSEVSVRLFLGTLLHAELKANLQQSPTWRESKLASTSETSLVTIWFQGKEYLGLYLVQTEFTVSNLQSESSKIRREIETHCPKLSVEALSIVAFPQIFIS